MTSSPIAIWPPKSHGAGRLGRTLLLTTLLAPCLRPRGAEAAESVSEAQDEGLLEEARYLFKVATEHYRAKRLARAAEAFQTSLALVDRPSTRFNLARTWQRMGRKRKAAGEYRAYLVAYPAADDLEKVERLAEQLSPRKHRRTSPAPLLAASEPLPLPPLPTAPSGARAAVASPPPHSSVNYTPTYAALAVAGGAVVTAAWFGASALQGRDTLRARSVPGFSDADREGAQRLARQVRTDALIADVMGAAAITAIATGVWWWIVPPDWAKDDEPKATASGAAGDL